MIHFQNDGKQKCESITAILDIEDSYICLEAYGATKKEALKNLKKEMFRLKLKLEEAMEEDS